MRAESGKCEISATIRGRVQQVGFRYYVSRCARDVGATGWVRNHPDGSVRLVAQGSGDVLEELIPLLRSGPEFADVTDVDVDWSKALDEYIDFTITV